MRIGLALTVALLVAMVSTVVWWVAADSQEWSIALLGIAGSGLITWLLLKGIHGHAKPVAAPATFDAPPGSTDPGPTPAWPAWVAAAAHVAYAWSLASFLDLDLPILDGDVVAEGAMWGLMLTLALVHLGLAVSMPRLARATTSWS